MWEGDMSGFNSELLVRINQHPIPGLYFFCLLFEATPTKTKPVIWMKEEFWLVSCEPDTGWCGILDPHSSWTILHSPNMCRDCPSQKQAAYCSQTTRSVLHDSSAWPAKNREPSSSLTCTCLTPVQPVSPALSILIHTSVTAKRIRASRSPPLSKSYLRCWVFGS